MASSITHLLVEGRRIIRFGIVGIVSTAVHAGTALFAVEIIGLHPVFASIIGQAVAGVVSYFGHALYSFTVKLDHRTYLWRFLVIGVFTFGLNAFVTWLLTDIIMISYRVAIILVTILVPVVNYLCNRYWVFLPNIITSNPSDTDAATSRRDIG